MVSVDLEIFDAWRPISAQRPRRSVCTTSSRQADEDRAVVRRQRRRMGRIGAAVTVTDPTACWFASMDSTSTPCWPIMSAVNSMNGSLKLR
jgi:hypothetical protein